MENPHATSFPLLDEVKLQARVLVPVVRALRERGTPRNTLALIRGAGIEPKVIGVLGLGQVWRPDRSCGAVATRPWPAA